MKVGEKVPEGIQSKEARKAFMKANMDAGLAAELAPDYAKAHYRKGLSLLGMPETQQRSKEAVMALQAALKCSDMSQGMAEEVKKVWIRACVCERERERERERVVYIFIV